MKWKRSDYVLSTKIFWGGSGPNDKGLSRKHIVEGTKVPSSSSLMPQLHACLPRFDKTMSICLVVTLIFCF